MNSITSELVTVNRRQIIAFRVFQFSSLGNLPVSSTLSKAQLHIPANLVCEVMHAFQRRRRVRLHHWVSCKMPSESIEANWRIVTYNELVHYLGVIDPGCAGFWLSTR